MVATKSKFIINAGSALVILILASFIVVSHWEMTQLAVYERKEDFTFSVIQHLDGLLKILRDIRKEQRSFSESGGMRDLEPYYQSLKEFDNELRYLYRIAEGHEWLLKRVAAIELAAKDKLAQFDSRIRHHAAPDAGTAMKTGGKVSIADIRGDVDAAKDEAVVRMRLLTAKQSSDFDKMEHLLVINSTIICILMVSIVLILKREIATRTRVNEHVVMLQEQERLALSREVHDDIGQNLTALKLDLRLIGQRLPPGDGESAGRLAEMGTTLDRLLDKTRDISAKLRPPLLENLGLAAAIEWQVNEFRRRTCIDYHLMLNEETDLRDQHVALAVIRVLQEALTNVIRHANASEVSISLCERGEECILEISDNGCGITAKEADSASAFGLMGIRERAALCNGRVTIKGNPGKGSVVSLIIPRDVLGGGK